MRALPEELAEGLVVGDGFVVVLGEAILDVLKAPLLHQLAGGLGLLGNADTTAEWIRTRLSATCRASTNGLTSKSHQNKSLGGWGGVRVRVRGCRNSIIQVSMALAGEFPSHGGTVVSGALMA